MPFVAKNPAARSVSSRTSSNVYCSFRPLRSIRIATRVGKRFDRRVEQIEQILVCVRALLLDLQLFFERRQNPFPHSREMDVEPVVVPVEPFRIPRQQMLFLFLDDATCNARTLSDR